ncbi:uncharacterized protein LOC117638296 [Prunus dulcis]|uniref:uncharacterized protein LOC117638296 n=1 Tax=Prunus dulcis TaxID=3755 RepID=UPI0014828B33|nr:uncharacterized protein LOC117638296 [Prunus dulcis]
MERFYKRKSSSISSSDNVGTLGSTSSSRQSDFDEVLANLQADPGLRTRMIDYDSNIRDEIRRAYLQKGPCQPKGHNFPQSNISGINRRFIPKWFDEFDWLKYSVSKDAAFCLYCYLFKSNFEQVGSEAFTGAGFKNWKKGRERMKTHVGPVGSAHTQAREAATNLMNQNEHIETAVNKHSEQAHMAYRTCLNASIKCTKFLLRHDNNEKVRAIVFENASGNLKFVGIQHVTDTTSTSLKDAIDTFFSSNGLSFSKLRGQGYDGASNMRVHVLQMIIDDNPNDIAGEANKLIREMLTFEFVFRLFLRKAILGVTNDLSQALQKKDQEIVNAMALMKLCKEKLHWMRNNGFDALVDEVFSFCDKHHIEVLNVDEAFVLPGRSRRNAPIKTNHHHYRVELFIYVIDQQLTELDDVHPFYGSENVHSNSRSSTVNIVDFVWE